MLGKLFRHEWNDTWKVGAVCVLAMMVTSLLGALLFSLSSWDRLFESENGFGMALFISYMMLIYFVFFGTGLVIRYFYFYRYYKNLYTDQGYLMFTLPTKVSDLIFSKLSVAVIWQYIGTIAMCFSIFILVVAAIAGVGTELDLSFADLYEGIGEIFTEPDFVKLIPSVIIGFVFVLLLPVLNTIYMYFCVAVGQLSKKGKFVLAVVMFIGTGMVLNMASGFFRVILISAFVDVEPTAAIINILAFIALAVEIGAIIGFYIWVKHLTEKKLNLE